MDRTRSVFASLGALKSVGLAESDVDIVNTKTQDTPALLKAGGASAIAAWQPNSGHALDQVPGSSALFTSAHVPGLIYDVLFVSPKSLQARRADWKKVVTVWFKVVAFVSDPEHRAEAARIMSQKAQMTPERYEKLMNGTQFLDLAENRKRFEKRLEEVGEEQLFSEEPRAKGYLRHRAGYRLFERRDDLTAKLREDVKSNAEWLQSSIEYQTAAAK